MDGAGSGVAECDAGHIAGSQEFIEKLQAHLWSFRLHLEKAADNHADRLRAEHAGIQVRAGRYEGFHRVNQGVDCAGGEEFIRKIREQLRDQYRIVRIDRVICKTQLRSQRCDLGDTYIRSF